jgi:hypothetical protein
VFRRELPTVAKNLESADSMRVSERSCTPTIKAKRGTAVDMK